MKWDWAKELYYNLLLKYKDKHGIDIYAYNLMDNHPHLAGHLQSKEVFSAFFRLVNSLFAKAVNKRLERKGQVVMDRFKSPRIETDEYMINAMAYIDMNQYRAKKVKHPKKNRWSSYQYYAYGRSDPLITPSPSYLGLGGTARQRQLEYRNMVETLLDSKDKMNISNTYYIGNPDWVTEKYKEFRLAMRRVYARYTSCSPPR